MAEPSAIELPSRPAAEARPESPNHCPMDFVEQGKMPACASPMQNQRTRRLWKSHARPTRPVSTDQASARAARTRRLPKRSASHPDGSCNKA